MHPLVDAFYKGRGKFKKHRKEFFDDLKRPKAACHLGAIYYGLFKKVTNTGVTVGSDLYGEYPEIRGWVKKAPCEHDDGEGGTVAGILVHLNDEHDGRSWPDEKIASWLTQVLAETKANPI